jgi:hypothetical protein
VHTTSHAPSNESRSVARGERREPVVRCSVKFDARRIYGDSHWRSLLHDHIRPRQHRLRDREAEGLRGLEVDHQLELGRLLDG